MSQTVIIKHGIVIDPELNVTEKKDIAIKDGVFVDIQEAQKDPEVTYIDAEGSYVAPGFIDLHVHVFKDTAAIGIEPDKVGVGQGVTTVVDAGSVGYDDYETFKKNVIEKSETEILSFLNISTKGLCQGLSELAKLENLMTLEQWEEIRKAEDSIVGLKARMSGSVVQDSGIKPLEHAREIADQTDTPIMVHIGNPPPNLEEIFPLLEKGDIVTHAFHGKEHGVLDKEGKLIPVAQSALDRGVLFDVGHGTDSFSFDTLMRYKESYDSPFTISTDVYQKNYNGPVYSLMLTMSKLLNLGYSLEDVVKSVTIRAAESVNLKEQGTLKLGTRGDVTIFRLVEEPTELVDSKGKTIVGDRILEPHMTLREGRLVFISE